MPACVGPIQSSSTRAEVRGHFWELTNECVEMDMEPTGFGATGQRYWNGLVMSVLA